MQSFSRLEHLTAGIDYLGKVIGYRVQDQDTIPRTNIDIAFVITWGSSRDY